VVARRDGGLDVGTAKVALICCSMRFVLCWRGMMPAQAQQENRGGKQSRRRGGK
jgi:hypothetical protein